MKVILWQATDGSIMVTTPCSPVREGESEQDYLGRVAARTQAQPGLAAAIAARLPDADRRSLPSRRFRDCWRWDGSRVVVDLPLARAQRLAELRHVRNAMLADSDAEKARLDDLGTVEEQAAHRVYRQALRDWPATVQAELAALTTVEQLEGYAPNAPSHQEQPQVIIS